MARAYDFANFSVRAFPIMHELRNPYIFGGVKVLVNVSTKKYSLRMRWALRRLGIKWYHFPMEEFPEMDVESLLSAVSVLEQADKKGEKVILHCMFGNNRSRTVAEAFYFRKYGHHLEDPYKDSSNHLIYNCTNHHLPALGDMEGLLR